MAAWSPGDRPTSGAIAVRWLGLTSGVTEIFSTGTAFAALKEDGRVIAWGVNGGEDDAGAVSNHLRNSITQIRSTDSAFAALSEDGSVCAWGNSRGGFIPREIQEQVDSGVVQLFATDSAFAALKEDGSVFTWGKYGGDVDRRLVADELQSGVTEIYSNAEAFAAIKEDGQVVLGRGRKRGDSSAVTEELGKLEIQTIASTSRPLPLFKSMAPWSHGGMPAMEAIAGQ